MSKTEDYLDNLLNSVEHTEETSVEDEGADAYGTDADADFFDELEREFLNGADDDFLRDLDREFAEEEAAEKSGVPEHKDSFLDNLDGIVSSVKANMKSEETEQDEAYEEDFMIDTIGEEPVTGGDTEESLSESESMMGEADVELDPELMDLLKSEGEFSELGDGLQFNGEKDAADVPDVGNEIPESNEMGMPAEAYSLGEIPLDTEEEEKTPEDKTSFLKKISRVLFGEEEEEEENEQTVKPVEKAVSGLAGLDAISDENLQILQELDGTSSNVRMEEPQEREEKPKKEKKKKEKKPKVPKAKKPKKEKKPKPPKEPDHTPPLPKKPVILTFVMVASFLALVLLGTKLSGYSNSMDMARRNYEIGNYEQALLDVSGLEIKEADLDTYQKYWLMANASSQYTAYQSFMEAGIYDMALDSLVRAIGKCEKYRPDAAVYGCADALDKVAGQAVDALSSFGMSKEMALELYSYNDRNDYSTEIYNILADAGLKGTE